MASTTATSTYVSKDVLRTKFAAAMSKMYRDEVPLYGNLIELVRNTNQSVLESNKAKSRPSDATGLQANIERLTQERHGAIRIGTPFELRTIKRIFEMLGMHPIGYYDLSIAGLPMHATCFRPQTMPSLETNPFRVFTTLLRPELIESEEARKLSLDLLAKRNIFSNTLLDILDMADAQGGGLKEEQTGKFITEALSTFCWKPLGACSFDQYHFLKTEHPILADIACFQSAHINHLTPRSLDISAVHSAMRKAGMQVKDSIEGPPVRECPILLRQTSFLALEEAVRFRTQDNQREASESEGTMIQIYHKARFGEIEERGAAVTSKGRELYDSLLLESKRKTAELPAHEADIVTSKVFKQFPDNWNELRQQDLIFCLYHVKHATTRFSLDLKGGPILEQLIEEKVVEAVPITYEDFLPFSAAGIFQSNLQRTHNTPKPVTDPELDDGHAMADPEGLEKAMGSKIQDLDGWYAAMQKRSIQHVAKTLGFNFDELMPGNT